MTEEQLQVRERLVGDLIAQLAQCSEAMAALSTRQAQDIQRWYEAMSEMVKRTDAIQQRCLDALADMY